MGKAQSSSNFRNHKLLLTLIFILTIGMCLHEVSSYCNNGFRTMTLYSSFTGGYLRIDSRKKIVAKLCKYDENCTPYQLHMFTIEKHYFLIYDPHAKMFICWNADYSKAIGRRFVDINHCKFEEEVSDKQEDAMTKYTTTYRNNDTKAVLEFNKSGSMSNKHSLQQCLNRKMKRQGHKKNTREKLKNLCVRSDFVAKVISCDAADFCKDMYFYYIKHKIPIKIKNHCIDEWKHNYWYNNNQTLY